MVILYFKDSSKNKFLVIINALVGKSSKNTRTGLGEYRWWSRDETNYQVMNAFLKYVCNNNKQF